MANNQSIVVRPSLVPAHTAVVRTGAVTREKHYVRKEEVDAALTKLTETGRHRHAAFLRFLWLTGARVSEALAVRRRDVIYRELYVVVPTLKRGGRPRKDGKAAERPSRTLPIPQDFWTELGNLIVDEDVGRDELLFPWSRPHAFCIVRDALRAVGVEHEPGARIQGSRGRQPGTGRAHPHALRHGHAIHALRNGASLDVVARALGHASVTTTSQYLRATAEDLRIYYSRIDW